ncbi:hypothetical protein H0H92_003052 [Tricholoma furcatifolium]|nr:hypothetical protein H0H92_003052 [Tricholoma furcatifolium]
MANGRPVRTTANRNPGRVVLDSQQTRRSTAEKKADEDQEKQHAAEAAATEAAELRKKIESTAAIEDHILQQDAAAAKYSAHPDRASMTIGRSQKKSVYYQKQSANSKGKSDTATLTGKKESRTSAKSKVTASKKSSLDAEELQSDTAEGGDDVGSLANPSIDFNCEILAKTGSVPPDSVFDTDSDGMAIELALDNAQKDLDDSSDPDYAGEAQDEESEDSNDDEENENRMGDFSVLKKKKTTGIDRGLRQVINNTRDRPPVQEIKSYKRKVIDNTDSDKSTLVSSTVKRAKKLEPTPGLRKDWRKNLNTTLTTTTTHPGISNDNNENQKEDTQDSKLSAVSNTRVSVKMQFKVEDVKIKASVAESTSTASKYRKMPVTCLPLPGSINGHEALLKWKTQFKATAINFAASLDQPFSANALLHNYVTKWWESVYDFTMEEYWTFTEERADALPAIVEQVSKVITEWRSSIGKEAIQILGDIFKTNEMTKEDIVIWVDEQCGKKGEFRWLYDNPDGAPGSKGAFQSDLVLDIFAYHLKQVSGAVEDYGLPIGGLALCTAAMERALELWAAGDDPRNSKRKENDRDAAEQKKKFGGDIWISCTAGYASLAGRLDEQWGEIIEAAEARVPSRAGNAIPDDELRAGLSLW